MVGKVTELTESVGSNPKISIWWFSWDISKLKRPIRFIFYSFEVLISTIELQSISSIGPLVMEIGDIVYLWDRTLVKVNPH